MFVWFTLRRLQTLLLDIEYGGGGSSHYFLQWMFLLPNKKNVKQKSTCPKLFNRQIFKLILIKQIQLSVGWTNEPHLLRWSHLKCSHSLSHLSALVFEGRPYLPCACRCWGFWIIQSEGYYYLIKYQEISPR